MSAVVTPDEVLAFWLDEIGPQGWYNPTEALDEEIRQKFMTTWEVARSGVLDKWVTHSKGALAYLIVTDQFPRNMFRGQGKAFATDRIALCASKKAVSKDWDMKIAEPARQFFYMPLMHSENLCDQERCIRLMKERMPEGRESSLLHARAHREVIRTFGRFPYRNEALNRRMTSLEQRYVADGGYGQTVQSLQAAS